MAYSLVNCEHTLLLEKRTIASNLKFNEWNWIKRSCLKCSKKRVFETIFATEENLKMLFNNRSKVVIPKLDFNLNFLHKLFPHPISTLLVYTHRQFIYLSMQFDKKFIHLYFLPIVIYNLMHNYYSIILPPNTYYIRLQHYIQWWTKFNSWGTVSFPSFLFIKFSFISSMFLCLSLITITLLPRTCRIPETKQNF